MEAGVRHALSLRGGGLTNFPADPALAWDIRLPVIRPADAEKHIKWFITQHGRLGAFDFTDPDTAVEYEGCRYGADELEVSYDGYNRCGVSCVVVKQ